MKINIGFLGDIVGRSGRNFVKENISKIKNNYNLQLLIANAENASGGTGLGAKEAIELKNAGIDLITLGDHSFSNNTILNFLNSSENNFCVTPCNYKDNKATREYISYRIGDANIVIFSLLGKVFLTREVTCPFVKAKEIVDKINSEVKNNIILLDFHAEATSEKLAMGYYLDSKISALLGTHTHVQTSDAKILNNGLGYITDAGMCGPRDGVIGMDISCSLDRLMGKREKGYKLSVGKNQINGVVLEVETESKKTINIEYFQIFEE